MGYTYHIEIPGKIILLEEWMNAVSQIEGVRIDSTDIEGINPITGEVITVQGNPGNVAVDFKKELLFGLIKKSEWVTCIFYEAGHVGFKAVNGVESPDNPLNKAVKKIAEKLNAKIIGDEGELFNDHSSEAVKRDCLMVL